MGDLTARDAAIATAVVALAVLLVCGYIWWSRPPQIGPNQEAVKSVDALFTAITAQDARLLGQAEQRLHIYRDDGRLPGQASDYLDAIVQKARAGRWQAAAERLYEFMKSQRGDSIADRPRKKGKDQLKSGRK